MKAYFRALLAALVGCHHALRLLVTAASDLVEARTSGGDLEGRLEAIERELQRWEAKVEAELLRAESKFKQARAAEERTRHAARALEGDEEGEDDQLEAWRSLVQAGDGARGEAGGVHPLRGGMEDGAGHATETDKQRLRRLKFS